MKSSSKSSRRIKKSFKRPTLQRLEARNLMAGDIGLNDSVLSIQGSDADEVAEVYVDGDKVHVKVSSMDASGQELCSYQQEYATDEVGRIVFSGGDGDDVFVNDSDIPAIARGGAGSDTLLGGTGNDILIGGIGDDFSYGGGGDDLSLDGPQAPVDSTPVETDDTSADDASSQPSDETMPSGQDTTDTFDPVPPVDEEALADSDDSQVDEQSQDDGLPVADATESDATESDADATCLDEDIDPAVEGDDNPDDEPEPLAPAAEDAEESVDTAVIEDAEMVDDGDVITEANADADPIADAETNVEPEANADFEIDGETDSNDPESPVNLETQADESMNENPNDEPISDPVPTDPGSDPLNDATMDCEPIVEEPLVLTEADDAPVENVDVIPETEPVEINVDSEAANEEADEEFASDRDIIFGGGGDDWLMGDGDDDVIFGNLSPIEDQLLREVIADLLRA